MPLLMLNTPESIANVIKQGNYTESCMINFNQFVKEYGLGLVTPSGDVRQDTANRFYTNTFSDISEYFSNHVMDLVVGKDQGYSFSRSTIDGFTGETVDTVNSSENFAQFDELRQKINNAKTLFIFNCANNPNDTQTFIEKVYEEIIEHKKKPISKTIDFYAINFPLVLSISKNLVTSTKISNNKGAITDQLDETILMCQHISTILSTKNAPEHHDLKELIDRLTSTLEKHSNELNNAQSIKEEEESRRKLKDTLVIFMSSLKKVNNEIDALTESRTGAFTLTWLCTGLLITLGVPPSYSLGAGISFFGSKFANIQNITGMSDKKATKKG